MIKRKESKGEKEGSNSISFYMGERAVFYWPGAGERYYLLFNTNSSDSGRILYRLLAGVADGAD